ncbi:aminotransferase class III-fold pyridoxal phosphate-dependent enzyme [Tsukamurella sp. 8F]|uniref:aminotransferase family protein n=1 Tax=unclassified Tsukamurella TaxID=2633480 RepID=UPI0023B899F0|nr:MULTISPECIES: aminotransferase class III-fold pyridoxal phosphate-dependent enzyme [unclassified Tsukamurella]MDF0532346.1 aminotransferase class III-fold pyridoxal phosphate-dependent enzyme [Tsukamurella sp. 8J]MDF0588814.1 aminotransferase class III-fold pyridoxal phosphate-dependent enzyme [Tsukamurella sp. 8F]
MTVVDSQAAESGAGAVLDGPALWPAQAHTPTVLGRQLVIDRAQGAYVYTADGRRLFDGTAGLWHANIGHCHPELAHAAFDQMNRLETYHTFARFVNDKALALGERLAAIAPIERAKVILGSGGSDAIDVACKLARRHWQREGRAGKTMIVSREFAYHGLHAYGTSIAGLPFNREGYGTESLVPETARVPVHDADALASLIDEVGADNIAAFITEPVQGTGGVNPPADGYLEAVQRLCRDNDILLILDEVITGFGRVGTMFAAERYGVRPDMVTFAKGVTSGYAPLGGVLVAPRIWEPFYVDAPGTPIFRHGATYAGHATAAAVALAHLDILEREELVPRVRELETVLQQSLASMAERTDGVVDVRVAGLLGGVTLADRLSAERVADDLIETGFISRPLRGNTLQISPPFIISDDELVGYVDAIGRAVAEADR